MSLKLVTSLIPIVLVGLLATPSSSCVPSSDLAVDTAQQALTGSLRIGYMQQVDSLNPYVGLNDVSRVFYGLVYDCLQSIGEDLDVTPNLARSWYPVPATDPDMVGMPFGSIWQYNLTRNATWSDGMPFTADDVVYNFWLNSGPTHYSTMWANQPYTYFMHDAWKKDNYTVRVSFWNRETSEPMPCSFANLLSIPILPKHTLDVYPYSTIGMNWTGTPVIGTGPFMATDMTYQEWLAGDHITLVRNPNYHQTVSDGRIVKFDQLVMRFFQDSTSMVLALQNGEIDVAAYPPPAYQSIKSAVQSGSYESVMTFDGPKVTQHWTEVAFDMREAGPNPSRLDPIVRQALHMATNKQTIVESNYLGLGEVGTTLIPPVNSEWHYEPNATEKAKFAYNLSAARDLLQANGYIDIDADGIRECTVSSPAVQMGLVPENKKMSYEMLVRKERPEEKDIAAYLKAQWATIGVDLKYLVVEEIALASMAFSYTYDSMIWDWSADVDPNYQLFVVSSYAIYGWSDSYYDNPYYDEAYRLSVSTINPVDRKQWVDRAQSIFYNDSAYIILCYDHQGYAWRNDTFTGWGNWTTHPGRSIDNYWSANPLFFDLTSAEQRPIYLSLTAEPSPARTRQSIDFTVSGFSMAGKAITFTIDFGDGKEESEQSAAASTDVQSVHIFHRYSRAGVYTLKISLDDGSFHQAAIELTDWMSVEEGEGVQIAHVLVGVALAAGGVTISSVVYVYRREGGGPGQPPA